MKTIESVTNLSVEDFYSTYFNKKPVIIKGGISDTRFCKNWTVEYLKQKIGNRSVDLQYASTGLFNHSIKKVESRKGSFDKIVDEFVAMKNEINTCYLAQSSIRENFPELMEDLEMPKFIKKTDLLTAINLWLGGKGCDSGLHYDHSHNFFLQVMGRKEMTLFAPDDAKYLYPNPTGENIMHISQVELYNIDHGRFPLFKQAQPFRVQVETGDSVYIPAYWWHDLLTLEMSISVNYWWMIFDVPPGQRARLLSIETVGSFIHGFLGMGYSVNHIVDDGELLLLKSIHLGFANVTEALLSRGADPNSKSLKLIPGASALYSAVEYDQRDQVDLLLKYGAEVTPGGKFSVLELAKKKGLEELVKVLERSSTVHGV